MTGHLIFLSGPISNGETLTHEEVMTNVRNAEEIMFRLIDRGWSVYAPHLHYRTLHDHLMFNRWSWNRWMKFDQVFLDRSDAMFYMEPGKYGESKGAELEAAAAREKGIPVYTRLDDVPGGRPDMKVPQRPCPHCKKNMMLLSWNEERDHVRCCLGSKA